MNKSIIEIKGLTLYAYHGVLEEEARLGQRFSLDIRLKLIPDLCFESDVVEGTLDYSIAINRIREIFEGTRYKLIERAGEVVADELLAEFSQLAEVFIRVKKPAAPVAATFEYIAVEITKCR